MLKFIRGKGQQPSTERQKIQRELFAFRKTIQHGFPNKPTCLAWDPVLRLMAIGTATGAIKVVGKPGVEFYGHHTSPDHHITHILFVPNEGRLISLCDDNSLHLWEINDTSMEEVKANKLEGKLNKITVMRLESSGRHLLLGLEGGNVNLLNVATFEFSSAIIFQDKIVQSVEEDYKINPGAVEAIEEQPGNPDNVLIGYNRGLMVLWNRKTSTAQQTFISSQQLESVSWEADGKQFVTSHNDGSYAYWDAAANTAQQQANNSKPLEEPSTPYGPFPCKAITKIVWTHDATQPTQDLLLFSGGMTRASYGDKNTITALRGRHVSEGKHVIFDFTSKIIDFFTISAADGENGVCALIVLAEEELVAIDLSGGEEGGDEWKMMGLPYLVSLHASAVTCATYVSDVPQNTWDNIVAVGRAQNKGLYSDAEWPINGGLCDADLNGEEEGEGEGEEVHRDILLTGHEDGSVRFWRAGGVALSPLYTFASKQAMHAQDDDDLLVEHPVDDAATADNGDVDDDDDDWPFRKVGSFDPYSDDPRLAVKKVLLCARSGILAVAGTAGHVIIAKLSLESATRALKAVTVNLVNDRDAFVWKGHSRLTVKGGGGGEGGGMLQMDAGFQPLSVVQLHPPAAVTALALAAQPLALVAVGTAHGLAVYDFVRHAAVAHKCTLNPNDLSGAGDVPISRRKSFKKSLRESFRRLRKGRSTRRPEKQRNVSTQQSPSTPESRKIVDSTPTSPIEAKPVERAIESRPVDDSLGSMVRCLAFAHTYIVTVQNTMPTLWAGTNNGTVHVFTISTARDSDKKKDAPIGCQLGKEIQLKHRAPVIGINVIDSLCYPVDPVAKHGLNPPHRVIISSEEQIKIFTLPQLKPFNKLKLTAAEGARVRRTALAEFRVSLDHASGHDQACLLCLTNLGDTIVLSLPDLRRQINAAVIRKEDINGISSLAFTSYGEGVYLHSSSELQRVTVSATRVTLPHCRLQLPKEARPHSQSADDESSSDDDDSSSSASSSSSSSSSSKSSVASQQQNKDVASKPSSEQQQQQSKQDGGEQQIVTSSAEKAGAAVVVNGVAERNGEVGVGEGEGEAEEREQDVTALSLSVGDITIDSVKDHLVNSSTLSTEESGGGGSTRVISSTVTSSTTVANSGGGGEVTTATNNKQETVSQQQETTAAVVVKRTTTVITTNNQTTTATPPHQPQNNESEAPELDSAHLLDEIRKAPLAKMEDLEMEMAA